MCPSASQPGKNQSSKNQSQKSPQADSAQSYDPSSFTDTFRAMARESLVKNQKNRPDSPIVSISPVLIVLGAIAAALYGLWQSWACIIPLLLILVLMWVRYTMQRQALRDFAELEAARTATAQRWAQYWGERARGVVSSGISLLFCDKIQ